MYTEVCELEANEGKMPQNQYKHNKNK